LKALDDDPKLLVIRPAAPATSLDHFKPFKLSTALMAVHKDCYAPIGLIQQGGPRRRETELLSQETEKIRASFSSLKNSGFSLDENIDLRTDGALGRDYEKATIAYELFERGRDGRLETPHEIAIPLARLLAYYDRLVDHILSSGNDAGQSDSEILLESAPLFSIDDALSESFLDRTELERLIESWKYKKNLILQGAPGVGKNVYCKAIGLPASWLSRSTPNNDDSIPSSLFI